MTGSIRFLTLTSISPHDGHLTVLSVPVAQIREIKDSGFPPSVEGIPDLPISKAKALVTMAGKDGGSYWTVEARYVLVDRINGDD